jgi:hypothetical protein
MSDKFLFYVDIAGDMSTKFNEFYANIYKITINENEIGNISITQIEETCSHPGRMFSSLEELSYQLHKSFFSSLNDGNLPSEFEVCIGNGSSISKNTNHLEEIIGGRIWQILKEYPESVSWRNEIIKDTPDKSDMEIMYSPSFRGPKSFTNDPARFVHYGSIEQQDTIDFVCLLDIINSIRENYGIGPLQPKQNANDHDDRIELNVSRYIVSADKVSDILDSELEFGRLYWSNLETGTVHYISQDKKGIVSCGPIVSKRFQILTQDMLTGEEKICGRYRCMPNIYYYKVPASAQITEENAYEYLRDHIDLLSLIQKTRYISVLTNKPNSLQEPVVKLLNLKTGEYENEYVGEEGLWLSLSMSKGGIMSLGTNIMYMMEYLQKQEKEEKWSKHAHAGYKLKGERITNASSSFKIIQI